MLPGDHLPVDGTEEESSPTEAQPLPVAAPPAGASQKTQCGLQKPTCPRCGLTVLDQRVPPLSPGLSRLQNSSLSLNLSNSSPTDSSLHLLLACLDCEVSVLLLGLLEACSSCLHTLCSSCCHACARCCSAIQEAPLEELNCHAHCHSVLFESCCEPTECLEFCLECCEICHRS
ncbi:myoD family inhibitor domain-containing protein-like [Centropristis striata]|uniref:myoD family inhibitor domain-containing protein-like n=1 Tax=Centropristis striata TaxID=184440 RepID=UPI0027DF5432|nr:myoD family inhibitor domain-containing protein-like [Centropristis striata]